MWNFYRTKWHCDRFSSHRFGFRCQWHYTMFHIQPYRNGIFIRRTNGRNLGNYIQRSALSYIGGALDRISLAYFLSFIYLYEPPRGFRRQNGLTGWLVGRLGDRQIYRAFSGQISAVIHAEQNLRRELRSLAFPVGGGGKTMQGDSHPSCFNVVYMVTKRKTLR